MYQSHRPLRTNYLESARHSVNQVVPVEARIFSSAQKQKIYNRLLLCMLVCLTVLPTLLGQVVYLLPTAGLRWVGYGAASLAIAATYLRICNIVPLWGYSKLKKQLANQIQQEGINLAEAIYVGFSPDSEHKIYEGCSNWDIGFLLLQGDRLYYLGEQTRFALDAQQITQVSTAIDQASLPQQGALALTWQSNNLASRSIRFQMLDAKSVRETVGKARSLQAQIETWRTAQLRVQRKTERSADKPFSILQAPNIKNVPSDPLSSFSLSTSLLFLVILWTISTAIALTSGSYWQLLGFIYFMPVIGVVLQAMPAIRRDRQRKAVANSYRLIDQGDTMISQISPQ